VVTAHLHAILSKLGLPQEHIPADEIKEFCKNSQFITAIHYRTLAEEYDVKTAKGLYIGSQLSEPDSNIVWYIVLRAVDRFHKQHNRYPGDVNDNVAVDVEGVKKCTTELLAELGVTKTVEENYIKEIVRYGNAELHSLASFIGGIASQEVLKLMTHQFSPMDNTFIYNGLKSTSTTAAL